MVSKLIKSFFKFITPSFGGGGGGSTTVQQADPWVGVQPYLAGSAPVYDAEGNLTTPGTTGIFPEAARLYGAGPAEYYPGETVAGFNNAQKKALYGLSSGAGFGGAQNYMKSQLNAKTGPQAAYRNAMLGKTPEMSFYRDVMSGNSPGFMNSVVNPVQNQVASMFGAAGRSGSPGMAQNISKGVSEAWAPYQMQAAQSFGQRGMDAADKMLDSRVQASQMLPQLSQQRFNNQLAAGGMRQGQDQRVIDADIARHDFGQNADWNNLRNYSSIVSPGAGMGGTQSATQSNDPSGMQQLTGGLLGLGAANSLLGGTAGLMGAGGLGSAALGMLGMF